MAICILSIQLWTFYRAYRSSQKRRFIIVQQMANTGLFYQKGRTLQVMSQDPMRLVSLAENYAIKEFLSSIQQCPLPNAFRFNGQQWIVIDSSAFCLQNNAKPVALLLTQSPRIHLERLLSSIQPDMVIADGSNYPADVARWKKSCNKMGIPFFSTSEKGAYFLKND